jgi:hypothetical protein
VGKRVRVPHPAQVGGGEDDRSLGKAVSARAVYPTHAVHELNAAGQNLGHLALDCVFDGGL